MSMCCASGHDSLTLSCIVEGAYRGAERELASVAVSRINGCVYCASVHAQRYAQLTKQSDVITRILDHGVATELEPRALSCRFLGETHQDAEPDPA